MSGTPAGKSKTQVFIYRLLEKSLPASLLRWLSACLTPGPNPPTAPAVPDDEKAKMDYEHSLKLSEIRWDKGCFALVAALVAGGMLLLGNYFLENYRSNEARQRVLTEKRLEALTSISAVHSRMIRAFFRFSHEQHGVSAEKATQEYSEAIESLIHEVNKHLVLLGKEFDKDISWYIQCHRYFREIGVTKCEKYGTLASNLDNEFNALCEAYLNKGRFPNEDRIVLKPIYREERITMKPEEYIAAQAEYRKQHGKNDGL